MPQGYGQGLEAAPGMQGGQGFAPGQGQGFGGGRGFGGGQGFHQGQDFGGGMMGRGGFPLLGGFFMAIIGLAILALLVFAFWQMFQKAGHPRALGLLMLVPLVNVGAVCYLAFSEWPVLKELKELREKVAPAQPAAVGAPVSASAADTTAPMPAAGSDT